jgi:hypothetical protein
MSAAAAAAVMLRLAAATAARTGFGIVVAMSAATGFGGHGRCDRQRRNAGRQE